MTNRNQELSIAIIFLQDTIDYTDIVKIHPWNPLAYGVILLLLLVASITFYRNWIKSEEYNKKRDGKVLEFNQQVLELMVKIQIRLEDQKNLMDSLKDLKFTQESMLKSIDEMKSKDQ